MLCFVREAQKYQSKPSFIRGYNCNQMGHKANKCPKPSKRQNKSKSAQNQTQKYACVSQRASDKDNNPG